MSRSERLTKYLSGTGIAVSEWSPGDGVTRYRFLFDGQTYFETDGIVTVLGYGNAQRVARGIRAGFDAARAQAEEDSYQEYQEGGAL